MQKNSLFIFENDNIFAEIAKKKKNTQLDSATASGQFTLFI